MGFSCGIVGLPNVGKSTIFNALTSAKAASENFPFCTIEPNTGAVPVPDPRLNVLAKLADSQKIIPTQMTFVDIAGLIKGASKGEGLGNQFLSHIRSVDAIAHVVRCFEDSDIVHVDGEIDPLRDIETIETELMLSDLDSLQKQVLKYSKLARSGDKKNQKIHTALKNLESHLADGKLAKTWENTEILEEEVSQVLNSLITSKPVLFVANTSEDNISTVPNPDGDSPIDKVAKHAKNTGSSVIVISGKIESEISEFSAEEREEYLTEIGITESGLDRLIVAGYQLLELMTFFTIGPKEAHAWTVKKDSVAPKCAGKIHTDFEKGFIRAEVIAYDDYVNAGSELLAKEAGKLRTEGRDYICQDGDIMHFRFNK